MLVLEADILVGFDFVGRTAVVVDLHSRDGLYLLQYREETPTFIFPKTDSEPDLNIHDSVCSPSHITW